MEQPSYPILLANSILLRVSRDPQVVQRHHLPHLLLPSGDHHDFGPLYLQRNCSATGLRLPLIQTVQESLPHHFNPQVIQKGMLAPPVHEPWLGIAIRIHLRRSIQVHDALVRQDGRSVPRPPEDPPRRYDLDEGP